MISMSEKHIKALSRCIYIVEHGVSCVGNKKFANAIESDLLLMRDIQGFVSDEVYNPKFPVVNEP